VAYELLEADVMRRALVFLGLMGAALLANCGSSKTDPCAGLGCAFGPGPLVIHMTGGVASPTFSENGQTLAAYCETDAGQIVLDAGSCDLWRIDTLSIGAHTITISAPGYASTTISVTISGPSGCCGQGPEVDKTVTLVALADAGDGGPVICAGVPCQPGFACCAAADGPVCAPAIECSPDF